MTRRTASPPFLPQTEELVHTLELKPISPQIYLEWFDLSSRPLLRLALESAHPARSVKIEWLDDGLKDGALTYLHRSNYTQILRVCFRRKCKEDGTWETFAEAAKTAGEKILDDAEKVLWYGKPRFWCASNQHPLSMCGGVLHFLRRRLYENDTVALRELRPLTLLTSRGEHDEFKDERHHTHEWVWEFSLQVSPGHYERGLKPVALPPTSPSTSKEAA